MDAASRVYQGCGPLAPADQPPILAPSCLRLAFSVRISGKFAANHATFPPHDNSAISMAYNLRTKSAKSIGLERIGPQREILGLFQAEPVNRSDPKTPGILPFRGPIGRAERADHFETGGWSGIRTHDTLLTYTHFPGARLRPLGHPSATGPLIRLVSVACPALSQFSRSSPNYPRYNRNPPREPVTTTLGFGQICAVHKPDAPKLSRGKSFSLGNLMAEGMGFEPTIGLLIL